MSIAIVIASRELREKTRLFAVCAVAAVLPFLAALLPGARQGRAEVIAVISGFLAIAFTIGTALAQGASTVGRELAERRLSFYFNKPVSPAAIWIGKSLVAIGTSLACFAIVTVPAYLAVPSEWRAVWMMHGWLIPLLILSGAVVLFFLSHVLSTMIRSRSALIGLDFLLAAAAMLVALLIVRPVVLGMARNTLIAMGVTFAIALFLVIAAAPIYQLAYGRTDVRQSHAALSTFLWIAIAAVLAIAGAWVLWLVSLSASDISMVDHLEQSPASDWMFVVGTSPARGDYHGTFLVDMASGRSEKLTAPPWWGAQFSRDGKTVAWLEPATFIPTGNELEVFTRRLDVPDARSVATGIRTAGSGHFTLSDDGSRIAVQSPRLLAVYELPGGRLLASAALVSASRRRMFFPSRDVVRLVDYADTRGAAPFRIHELDVRRRRFTKTAEVVVPAAGIVSASGDGSRVLLQRTNLIVDGRTGAKLATLPSRAGIWVTAMLHDGRVARVVSEAGRAHVLFYDLAGELLGRVPLTTRRAWISGELTDGKVILVGFDERRYTETGAGGTMFVVDGKSVVQTVRDVKGPVPQWRIDPRTPRFDAARPLAGVDAKGAVVLWNPRTGETKRPG